MGSLCPRVESERDFGAGCERGTSYRTRQERAPALSVGIGRSQGGKSIHSWYFCEGLTDEQLRPFMVRAVQLGADPATWTRCQLVRMPDGIRENGKRQQVHFFAPEVIRLEGGA
jgi:hypothetical protein